MEKGVSSEALVRGLSKSCGYVDGGPHPRTGVCVDGGSCSAGLQVWSRRPHYWSVTWREFQCRAVGVVRGLQGGCEGVGGTF